MIITAQPFLDELDLLELKCEALEGVVDLHVVVEATLTYTGLPKPLHFAENAARFARWPIHHVIVENLPSLVDEPDPWRREYLNRCAIFQAVQKLNPEIVLWIDTDELIRPDTISRFRRLGWRSASLVMDQLLYFFDRVDRTEHWNTPKIAFWDPACEHWPWRMEHHPDLPNAGWHFEYFGGRERVTRKSWATSHAHEPAGYSFRAQLDAGRLPGLERTSPYPFDLLPESVKLNPARYREHFQSLPAQADVHH